MKTKSFFLLLTLCFFTIQAQSQNKECGQIARSVDSLVKAADYENAYKAWILCPDSDQESLYVNGEKVLLYKLTLPNSEESTKEFLSLLERNYDNYDKKFPGNKNGNLVKKAMLGRNYKTATDEEVYAMLDKAFAADRENFTDANSLYVYFELFYDRFKTGKGITEDMVFARQDEVNARLAQLSAKQPEKLREFETASGGIRALTAGFTTCEKLVAYYGKNFETKKTDAAWMETALGQLAGYKCTSAPLYLTIAMELYKLRPDAASAYALGMASIRNKQLEKGIAYLNTAVGLEQDPGKKADIYYSLATLTGTEKEKAYDYLRKALAAKPSYAKAYLMLAQLYAESGCGETAFEKKAIWLLAAQTAKKAGEVDAYFKKAAQSQSELYLKKAPSKQEIKQARKAGKKITYGCGINESIVVPE